MPKSETSQPNDADNRLLRHDPQANSAANESPTRQEQRERFAREVEGRGLGEPPEDERFPLGHG